MIRMCINIYEERAKSSKKLKIDEKVKDDEKIST